MADHDGNDARSLIGGPMHNSQRLDVLLPDIVEKFDIWASLMARLRALTKSLEVSWLDSGLPVSERETQGPIESSRSLAR